MSTVSQIAQILKPTLEDEARRLGRETGFIQRERKFAGADFAQALIFGFLQTPDERVDGLCQVLERRKVSISGSGLSQRFTAASARFMKAMLQLLSQQQLNSEVEEQAKVELLRRFSAVIIEDSSTITLPPELADIWRGCGGSGKASKAACKLFTRWDVLSGHLDGPRVTAGKQSDARSPFRNQALPEGGLYVADLGFFDLKELHWLGTGHGKHKRYVVTRMQPGTHLYTRSGHQLVLRALLPRQVGQVRQDGVLVGKEERWPMRLILVCLPEDIAKKRRQRLIEEAKDKGQNVSEETLYLAGWLIVLTNAPTRLLDLPEVLILLRLRWQIERLFRLWKEHGQVDEWRSKKSWRILTEMYSKLCAMLIQQWLISAGCWQDPYRSLVKAAHVVRKEANRIMVALYEGQDLEPVLRSILRCMRSGCRIDRRKKRPSTAQLLTEGLDWHLQFA